VHTAKIRYLIALAYTMEKKTCYTIDIYVLKPDTVIIVTSYIHTHTSRYRGCIMKYYIVDCGYSQR